MTFPNLNYRKMMKGFWVPDYSADRAPMKATIDGVKSRGTYHGYPYLVFCQEPSSGQIHLILDQGMHLVISADPSNPKRFTLAPYGSSPSLPDGAALEFGGDDNFTISGMADESGISPVRYSRVERKAENTGLSQTLGNIFVHKINQLKAVLRGYNVTKMTVDNLQDAGNAVDVFKCPPLSSKKYVPVGDEGVPYGWTHNADDVSYGSGETKLISTGRELQQRTKETLGEHSGLDIFGLKIGTQSSTAGTSQLDDIYNNELTLSVHTNVLTRFAYVLDKTNVTLADDFYLAVFELKKHRDFNRFFDVVGTHFTNATTFGGKGYVRNAYTKEQVVAMHDQGVDLESSVSFGFSEKYGGQGAGAEGGINSGIAKGHFEKFESIVGKGNSQYFCIGDCTNGDPTGTSIVPVLADLRPISDLLAPPFFSAWEIIVTLRQEVVAALQRYALYSIDERTGASTARFYRYRYISNRVLYANGDGTPAAWASALPGPHTVNNVAGAAIEVSLWRGSDTNIQASPENPAKQLKEPGDEILLTAGDYVSVTKNRQFLMEKALEVPNGAGKEIVGSTYPGVYVVGASNVRRPRYELNTGEGAYVQFYVSEDVRRTYNLPKNALIVFFAEFSLEPVTTLEALGIKS